jgi:serine/threonine protein kinase
MACQDCAETFSLPSDRAAAIGGNLADVLKARAPAVANFANQQEIARGGMGAVLQCTDPALLRPVAMKVMSPNLARSDVDL